MYQIDAPLSAGDEEYYDDTVEVEYQILEAIKCDDKVKFVTLAGKMDPGCDPVVCPFLFSATIFSSGAINCAAALLNAETKYYLDINALDVDGVCPLHVATFHLDYAMIDLLLRRAARTDVRTTSGYYTRGNLIPLNIALELIRYHHYLVKWTPGDSIFKLIFLLCLPQLKAHVQVCDLLARRTDEVHKIFLDYAMEGKLIEMAALLMAARVKILGIGLGGDKVFPDLAGGATVRNRILFEIARVHEEYMSLTERNNGKSANVFTKKQLLKNSLLLLEVFGRIGYKIDSYFLEPRRNASKEMVVSDIKKLIETSGYVLTDKDIDLSEIDCESEDVKQSTSTPVPDMPISFQAYGGAIPAKHLENFKEKPDQAMDPRVMQNFIIRPHCSSTLSQGPFWGRRFSCVGNMHSQSKSFVSFAESSTLLSPKRLMSMFHIIKRGLWHK